MHFILNKVSQHYITFKDSITKKHMSFTDVDDLQNDVFLGQQSNILYSFEHDLFKALSEQALIVVNITSDFTT